MGAPSSELLWPNVKKLFYDDLERLYGSTGPWDAVFFAGDLTYSGSQDEFEKVTAILEDLWSLFARLGCTPIFVCVPGNHDVVRPDPGKSDVVALQQWHRDDRVPKQFWSKSPSEYRDFISDCLKNYTRFMDDIRLPTSSEVKKGMLPGDFSAIVAGRDMRCGVVGMNTTYLHLTDGDTKGALAVNIAQIHDACNQDLPGWSESVDIALLMTHHPPSWLHPSALDHFRAEIAPPGRFASHVCGHLHVPQMQDSSESGSPPTRLRCGVSMFGLKHYAESRTQRLHGYAAMNLVLDDTAGKELFWPRLVVKTYDGHYRIDADVHYELNDVGCVESTWQRKGRTSACASLTDTSPPEVSGVSLESEPATVTNRSDGDSLDKVVSLIGPSPNEDIARLALQGIPRFVLKPEPQHVQIRIDEQTKLADALQTSRYAWLVSDWGLGKMGFLAAALERVYCSSDNREIFHVDCENAETLDQFMATAERQFASSLQRFCSLASLLPFGVLIVDEIQEELLNAIPSDKGIASFWSIVHSILDYCPNLRVILTSRHEPLSISCPVVRLRPLDVLDVRSFLAAHPGATPDLHSADAIETIHMRSEGIPAYIESIIEKLAFMSLHDLLDLELDAPSTSLSASEPVPAALRQAVAGLSTRAKSDARRTFKLLKLLSVLANGESYRTIRYFYQASPFTTSDVQTLIRLSLVEIVNSPDALPTPTDASFGRSEGELAGYKLLRVPRQVRDYVWSLIPSQERSDIVYRAAELYFGDRWHEGVVKLRFSHATSESQADCGLGNEHIVALKLLWNAHQSADLAQVRRAAHLGLNYCYQLLRSTRYRDAALAADDIRHLIDRYDLPDILANLERISGQSHRMLGRHTDAVRLCQSALEHGDGTFSHEQEALTFLDIALSHHTRGSKAEAMAAAKSVLERTSEDEAAHIHAESIVAECSVGLPELLDSLRSLRKRAQKRGHRNLANTLALSIAGKTEDNGKCIRIYNEVLTDYSDSYNRVRAIVSKSDALLTNGDRHGLSAGDSRTLCAAYSYLHAQKFGGLFDDCHKALWMLFEADGDITNLLRIFRHSSFLWRLRGKESIENSYLNKLISIDAGKGARGVESDLDMCYFQRRCRDGHVQVLTQVDDA